MFFRGILVAFALTASVASADTLLTTFGNSPYVQATPPEWLWDGGYSELSLLANTPSNYWEQTSFGSIEITGAIGVSLQARFYNDFGFTTSNDSFKVRLVSGNAGSAKADAVFDFFDFQGAQTTVAKAFTSVDNDFNYGDVQIIYLIGNSNVAYSSALGSIKLDRLTAVNSLSAVPEIDPAGMGSVLALLGGVLGLLERRRKRA